MVVEVCDDGPVVGGETDASRGVKVTPQGPVVPVLDDKVAGGRKQLDAVVAGVGDQDLVPRVAGHVPRVVELAVTAAL